MSKFKVIYSAMGGTKTRDLLATEFNFRVDCGLRTLVVKPLVDDRTDVEYVSSRDGGKVKADIVLGEHTSLFMKFLGFVDGDDKPFAILVDEVQFLTKQQVYDLATICDDYGVHVFAYGLKNDSNNEMFEGMKYALLLSDEQHQIKTTCRLCNNKAATMNMRFVNGIPVFDGEQIHIGGNECYKAACRKCYMSEKYKQLEGDTDDES